MGKLRITNYELRIEPLRTLRYIPFESLGKEESELEVDEGLNIGSAGLVHEPDDEGDKQ
jgi:hypothetical protein